MNQSSAIEESSRSRRRPQNARLYQLKRGVATLFPCVCLALAIWGMPHPARAVTTIYTNETAFAAAAGNLPSFVNEFTNIYLGWWAHPLPASSNGISYRIESIPALFLYTFNGVVSTWDTTESINVTFTSGNVTGAGGYFYAANGTNGAPVTGSVTVSLDDGTVTNLTS